MAVEIMDVGEKFRKIAIFVVRGCFRLVRHHPFIVGMLSFLIYLYISSPFVFSLLVSTSPVLICTALLLGILLSYGESNVPEIEEIEEKSTRDSVLVKKIEEVPLDSSLVERDESFDVERYSDELGLLNDHQLNPSASKTDEVRDEDDSADDTTPLIGERLRRIESDDVVCERKQKVDDLRNKQKIEYIEDGETSEHQYAPIPDMDDEHLQVDDDVDDESDTDSFDSQKVNVDSLDSPPHSPWSRIEETEEKEGINEENDVSDSESDGSESSSPDASMAEIRPMLDELHPLLSEEAPRDVSLNNDRSEHSLESSLDNQESADDVLENEEEGDAKNDREGEKEGIKEEDDVSDSESDGSESSSPDASMAEIRPMLDELHPLLNEEPSGAVSLHNDGSEHSLESSSDNQESEDDGLENEEEDDGVKNDGDEGTKSAITWTEEDQKNLMDLGSSEIERNLRLEHLIMRRRSRRNLVSEKNLIDLDGFDLPFSIPSITTRRQNPFDTPEGSNDSELPPIPGSAPSILLPRRNPFDLPYDSSEEKPDLKGDGFEDEFKTVQPRESVFRRYESFKAGPSSLAPERQNVMRMRPYFVPERTFSEESNYSLFQRQSSGVSESKVSSVPETESLGSVDDLDLEERKISGEDDDLQEPEAAITTVEEEGSSKDHQLIISDADDSRDDDHVITHEPVEDETSTHEPELISKIVDDFDIGHGSESSEKEGDSQELGQVDVHVLELETQLGDTSDPYQEDFITRRSVEFESASTENVVQMQSRSSSSSSLSEVSERIYTDPEPQPEGFFALEEEQHIVARQEPDISAQNSVESAHPSISRTTVPDILPREQPVYDSSPREVTTNLIASSSSVSSDVHQGSDYPLEITESSIPSVEREVENKIYADVFHELMIESSEHINQTESTDEEHVLISEYDAQNHDRERVDISLPQNTDTDVDHEADERLGFTTSAEENASLVSDEAMHEPTPDDHLHEVHASIATPEESNAVVYMPKIFEEADAIVEFDQELLSELDFIGDFSNNEISNEVTSDDCSMVINNYENISGVSEVQKQADEIAVDKDEFTASVSDAIVGDDDDSLRIQSEIGSTHELHEVEANMMPEDTESPFKKFNDEKTIDNISFEAQESNVVTDEPQADQSELGPVEGRTKGSSTVPYSADEAQHPVESDKTRGNMEMDVFKPVSSENTYSPPEQVTEVKAEDKLRSYTDDGSLEVQEDHVRCSSMEELTNIRDLSTNAVEDSITAREALSESHETEVEIHSEVDCRTGKEHIETMTDTDCYPSVAVEESSIKDVAAQKPDDGVEEHDYVYLSSSGENF